MRNDPARKRIAMQAGLANMQGIGILNCFEFGVIYIVILSENDSYTFFKHDVKAWISHICSNFDRGTSLDVLPEAASTWCCCAWVSEKCSGLPRESASDCNGL